ncbi:hypothetical protein JJJ17_00160 [Paracoccus caeni]|uniref:Type III secretion protein n=1 Tax=Paracoccus caeni TaxID=657651 RepID=A0A934SF66_9RHOB|nr:hypothetical protein [Paracoccus caeni]MBK4214327.1 hypothetical protein [Paracoccus caeni]
MVRGFALMPVLGVCALLSVGTPAVAQHPDLLRAFPYAASDERADTALRDLMRRTGIPVITSNEISGTVSVNNSNGSIMDVLNSISEQVNGVWWFDGSAVRVEPSSVLTSRMIPLDGFTVGQFRQQVRAVRLEDTRFPISASEDASMIRLSGPTGYVDAVEALAVHLAELRRADKPVRAGFPVIIRGRETTKSQTETQQQETTERSE